MRKGEPDLENDRDIERTTAEKRGQLRELSAFDANIWLGRPAFFPLAKELHPAEAGTVLQEYGLQGALISHWDSVRFSAQDGNLALMDAGGALPENVFTVWTGLPTVPREQEPLPGFGSHDPRLRGVRLFPKTHQFQLAPWVVGELSEWCIERRIPLFLWHVEIEWSSMHALAAAFPRLRIVIETQWQKILYHNRDLFSLLRACPNIMVESSNLVGQDNVGYLVKNFGAERLLFGSFLPVNDPYAAIGMILDADISEDEKKLVAGGNLRKIIAEVKT
jgi:hypothetical protein